MTAEKGEHERAPRAGESCPTPLRATLRAPPSKWAIEAFFRRVSAASRGRGQPRRGYRRPKPTARSDVGRLRSRRAAGFLWYFLSHRKKVLPLSGRQPHRSRRSRRVNPPEWVPFRQSWRTPTQAGGFPLTTCTPSVRLPKQNSTPIRLHLCFRAVVGAPFHRLGGEILTTEPLTADKSRGSFLGANTRQSTACRSLPLEKQTARLVLPCRLLLC